MKKKIVFIIHSLIGGGAEKVLIDIINHLDVDKYILTPTEVYFQRTAAK